MSSQNSGINRWIAGIRYRMENDPGRQDLDDHVLYSGFLFLDEYLEDILMGAKTEPIIELTKTPGRRKDISKKVRSATAAATKTASLQELESPDKENTPATKFPNIKKSSASKRILLKASKENQLSDHEAAATTVYSPSRPESHSLAMPSPEKDVQEGTIVGTLIAPLFLSAVPDPRSETVNTHIFSPSTKQPVEIPDGVAAVQQEDTGAADAVLCIPEDDESGILRVSGSNLHNGRIVQERVVPCPAPKSPTDPMEQTNTATPSYDPNADDQDGTQAFRTPIDRSFNDSEPTSTASSFPIDPYARDYETHELCQIMETEQVSEQVPLSQSPRGQTRVRKASVPVFPNLPGPSPLRKSTHDPGSVHALINTHSSVTTGTSTRSSWLSKARDVPTKHISVVSGAKRKSVDIEPSLTHPDGGSSRAAKIAKTNGEEDSTNSEVFQSKTSIQPFRPIILSGSQGQPVVQRVAAVAPDVNPERMMDILKRTVEGLGARSGKGMGRSLGGAAAAAAAAEAKAAAEVRLAQRDAKGSDGNKQSRLSVSELVSIYDDGEGKGKGYSPIQQDDKPSRPPVLGIDSGSMINIPRMPDSPSIWHKSPVSSTMSHIIPKFTVQRHLPLAPTLSFSDSQPSTQSTYVPSIFDDHTASSQTTDITASQGFSQAESQTKDTSYTGERVASVLSQEVGWTHNLPDRPMLYDQAADELQRSKTDVVRNRVDLQGEGSDGIPGASVPQDEDMALNDPALYGIDVESEEETTIGMYRSTSSALSETSTTKSQPSSQTGFVAHASDLISRVMGTSVSSMLGTNKRSKAEPVKSIQLAAAAAKKQQEEADRKAARLREMDKRRAAIALKKAEQEAVQKAKKQGEPRKRDREDGLEKKVTRTAVKRVEDDATKKRKVVVEIEPKPEVIKIVPKDKQNFGGSRTGKPGMTVSQTQPAQGVLSKSVQQLGPSASASQSTVKLVGASQGELKPVPNFTKSVAKDKPLHSALEDVQQPSGALNAQMQARVEAQLPQAQQNKPVIPSESIELPDINSEYSDSDDENRPRTFDPPGWAQSPDLRLALESQSRMNPDDIFGPVRPLRMEEIFPTKQSRFRARTSSANWAGTDEVTHDEEMQYAKRMGYLD